MFKMRYQTKENKQNIMKYTLSQMLDFYESDPDHHYTIKVNKNKALTLILPISDQ